MISPKCGSSCYFPQTPVGNTNSNFNKTCKCNVCLMYLCHIELIAEADIFFEILHHTLKLSKPFVTLYQISVTFAPPAAASLSKSLSFFRVEASSHHYKFSETQNHSRFSSGCSGCLCCIFLPTAIFSPPIKEPKLKWLEHYG